MSDVMSLEKRKKLMSRIRGKDTLAELKLRSALWQHGLRYRIHYRIGRFKPDIVFLGPRLAIFVDGCFWHSCPLHGVKPKTNQDFWKKKLEENIARDHKTNQTLRDSGWNFLRFWEHEIDGNVDLCVSTIISKLNAIAKLKSAIK